MKLVAIDLDGTLLNSNKEISQRNQAALRAAKAQGVKVVICTGRPLASIHQYIDILGLNEAGDYSITFNGGLVQKNDTGEVLAQFSLSFAEVAKVFEMTQSLELPLDVVEDGSVYHVLPQVRASLYETLNPA